MTPGEVNPTAYDPDRPIDLDEPGPLEVLGGGLVLHGARVAPAVEADLATRYDLAAGEH